MLIRKECAVVFRFVLPLVFLVVTSTANSYSADDPRHYGSLSSSAAQTKLHSTSSQAARIDGDIFLGGLFPVHAKGNGSTLCGEINEQVGIHRVEAMLYAIDQVFFFLNLLSSVSSLIS